MSELELPDESGPLPKSANLWEHWLLLLYRRLIALALAAFVAATALWEYPFPRGTLLESGFLFVTSGFLLFALLTAVQALRGESEPPAPGVPRARRRRRRRQDGARDEAAPSTPDDRALVGSATLLTGIVLLTMMSLAALLAAGAALGGMRHCATTTEDTLCAKKAEGYTSGDRAHLLELRREWRVWARRARPARHPRSAGEQDHPEARRE